MKKLFFIAFLFISFFQQGATQGSLNFTTACSPVSFCLPNNSCTEAPVFVEVDVVSGCSTPSVSWQLDLDNNGSIDKTGGGKTITDTLLVGEHRVKFRAVDICGNVKFCEFTITVTDCTAPALTCITSFTVNLATPDCSQSFQAETFILNLSDNCTPRDSIDQGLRRANGQTTFPTSDTIILNPCDIGQQTLQVWVRDSIGRMNVCNTILTTLNNAGDCSCGPTTPVDTTPVMPPPPLPINYTSISTQGCITTPSGAAFSQYDMHVQIEGTKPADSFLLNDFSYQLDSCFLIAFDSIPRDSAYKVVVTPSYDSLLIAGVNTYDMLLIQKHLLGIEPLTSAYQFLAADVNNSGTITPTDIIDLRKVLLGISSSFGRASFQFLKPLTDPSIYGPNYSNALSSSYTDSIGFIFNAWPISGLDFVAFKTGDINQSFGSLNQLSDRENAKKLPLLLDIGEKTGNLWKRVQIKLPENADIEALQFAFKFDANQTEIRFSESLPDGVFYNILNNEIRFSLLKETASFSDISFEIKTKNGTSNASVFSLKKDHYKAEAYGKKRYDLDLKISKKSSVQKLHIYPNPAGASNLVFIDFPPENKNIVDLKIYNAMGQIMRHLNQVQVKENTPLQLSTEGLATNQLYFIQVQTEGRKYVGKFLKSTK